MDFHHWPVHRHLGEKGGGRAAGRAEVIHLHLAAGGRTAPIELHDNYTRVTDTIDETMQRVTVFGLIS